MAKRWTDNLPGDVYDRLCACRSSKADIPVLVNARYAWYKEAGKAGYCKEDALIAVLELLDSNGRYFDLADDEYKALCAE